MKPRIFVSSTYYDLKHVRERLEKFIDNYGFESVLFESDKVTYELDKPIDESAYNEVTLCHIMILIIGGRYGTSITTKNPNQDIKRYEDEYISITRREFETASTKNIPIFIFVDKNVYSEYETFKENQELLEKITSLGKDDKTFSFKFAHVDSVNIFKFIDVVKSKPIKTFDRVEQIENYLQTQIAGLFYLYLDGLQKQKEVQKVLDSVQELSNISLRMNEMLNSVGKKILQNENEGEYKAVIDKQLDMIIDFFADQLSETLSLKEDDEAIDIKLEDDYEQKMSEIIYNTLLKEKAVIPENKLRRERSKWINEFNETVADRINSKLQEINIPLKIEPKQLFNVNFLYHDKVKPFLIKPEDEQKVIERLESEMFFMIP